jgi:hypothetical protein
MPVSSVLIKFIGSSPVSNVVGGIAMAPELLIFVGYGHFLTDKQRMQYNRFFSRRNLVTAVAEAVELTPGDEPGMEKALMTLLDRHIVLKPVIDITDADHTEAFALSAVMSNKLFANIPLMDFSISKRRFLPQKNADRLRHLPFPSLTYAEIRFLNFGTDFQLPPGEERRVWNRKDLTRPTVRAIRTLFSFFGGRPDFWAEVSDRMRLMFASESGRSGETALRSEKISYVFDEKEFAIPGDALEDLNASGLITALSKKNGVVSITFVSPSVIRLLLDIREIGTYVAFLTMAYIRNARRTAAYHDLMLMDGHYAAGIIGCFPVIVSCFGGGADDADIFSAYEDMRDIFPDPCRRIAVFSGGRVPESAARAAEMLGMETCPLSELSDKLELR